MSAISGAMAWFDAVTTDAGVLAFLIVVAVGLVRGRGPQTP